MDAFTRDGLTFDVRDHVPAEPAPGAPVAVLLHGFPQDGWAYDEVAALLAARGVRGLAPDQRGYSPGARPAGRAASAVPELVADVLSLVDAAGVDRAHLVGHDWGGSVAWAFAHRHPRRTASLTVLGTPHPAAIRHGLRRGGQALRSAYVLAFQVPRLPELALLRRDGGGLRRALTRSGLEPARADRYVARMREPGALAAALGWYRALPTGRGDTTGTVRVPTTYLTGRRDPFFAPASVAATRRHVDAPFTHRDLDADHWLPEHRAGDVAAAVLAHVAAG